MSGQKRGPVTIWKDVLDNTKDILGDFDATAKPSTKSSLTMKEVPPPSCPQKSGQMLGPNSFFNYSFEKNEIAVVGDQFTETEKNVSRTVPYMSIMMIRGKDPNNFANGSLQYAPTLKILTPIGEALYDGAKGFGFGNLALKDGRLLSKDEKPVELAANLGDAKTQHTLRINPDDPDRGADHQLFVEFLHALRWLIAIHLYRDTPMHTMSSSKQSVAAFFNSILATMKDRPEFEDDKLDINTMFEPKYKSYVLRSIYRKLGSGIKSRADKQTKDPVPDTEHIASAAPLMKKMYARRNVMPPRVDLPAGAPPEIVEEFARNPDKTFHNPPMYAMTGGCQVIPPDQRHYGRGDRIALGLIVRFTAGNPDGQFVGPKFETEAVFFHSRNPNPIQAGEEIMVAYAADAEMMDTGIIGAKRSIEEHQAAAAAPSQPEQNAPKPQDSQDQAAEPPAKKIAVEPVVPVAGTAPDDPNL